MDRKKIKKIFTMIFLLSVLLTGGIAGSVVADNSGELYKKGIEALKAGDTLHAELLFKESIRENSDAPSYFELAKIDLNRNTFVSRNRAFGNFQMAVWIDPSNIEYKYGFAELCKDFARFTAIEEYKKILTLDSTQVNAWINLGAIKEKEFTEYDQSFRSMDGILAPLQRYADEDFNEAEKYYLNALSLDSSNYEASLKLSLLYEAVSKPEKGITLLKRLVNSGKDDKQIHLCLGLLYYKTNKIKESFNEYKIALANMDRNERKDFTLNSVKFLLEPILEDKLKKMDDDELENFIELYWKVSEPLYLTTYNERLLEHYSRVAYSNLHFSVPKMGITGWKSNRGEVVLRYGEPLNRIRMRPQMGDGKVEMKTDLWNYKNFTLGFTDMAQSGNFIFSAPAAEKDKMASQFGGDSQTFMEDLRRGVYTYYEPKFDGPKFDVPYNIVQLKNPAVRNHTDVIITYGMSVPDSSNIAGSNKFDHEVGIFFFDKNYEELEKKKERIEKFDYERDLFVTAKEKFLTNTIEIPMRIDSGFVALELKRGIDNGTSANRSKIKIKKFSYNRLDISDLLLASNVELNKTSGHPLKRKDLYIRPNPTNRFDKYHQPYLYYEIYNLSKDADGLTNFEQNIIVTEFNEEEGVSVESAFNSVLNILGIGKEKEKISLSSSYKTPEKDPQVYFQLDLSKYLAGKYLIAISVKDKLSGNVVETKAVVDWKN